MDYADPLAWRRARKAWEAAKVVLSALAFCAMMVLMCVLCIAVSDYNWN